MSILAQRANLIAKGYANLLIPGSGISATFNKSTAVSYDTSTGTTTPTITNYSLTVLVAAWREGEDPVEGSSRKKIVIVPFAQIPTGVTINQRDDGVFSGARWEVNEVLTAQPYDAVVCVVSLA